MSRTYYSPFKNKYGVISHNRIRKLIEKKEEFCLKHFGNYYVIQPYLALDGFMFLEIFNGDFTISLKTFREMPFDQFFDSIEGVYYKIPESSWKRKYRKYINNKFSTSNDRTDIL